MGTDVIPLATEIAQIFSYRLAIDHGNSVRPGAELEPATVPASGMCYPTAIDAAHDDVVQLWAALAEHVTEPLPSAVLHDLQFVRRLAPVGDHAQRAGQAYLKAAGQLHLDIMTRAECSLRSWTLSRRTGSVRGEKTARQIIRTIVEEQLSEPTSAFPGVVLPLLAALTTSPKRRVSPEDHTDLDTLLGQALSAFTTDYQVDYLVELMGRRPGVGSERRTELNRHRVLSRLAAADASHGHLKMHWLNEAAQLGRQLGTTDLADRAVADMQAIPQESLEWISIPLEIDLPKGAYERHVRQFVSHRDWRRGLCQWLGTDAPSGNYEANRRSTERSLNGLVFHKLLRSHVFGAHGLPQNTVDDDESELNHQIQKTETLNALTMGMALADALQRIGDLVPNLHESQLTEFLHTSFKADEDVSRTLARAIKLYWRGEYQASAFLITPSIEAAARHLLLALNAPLYRVEKGRTIGQYPGLGALLPDLEREGLDPDWIRFLKVLLLPDGRNLRNLIAHGFLHDVQRHDAALLLRAAAMMILMPIPQVTSADRSDVKGRLVLTPPPKRTTLERLLDAYGAASREFTRSHEKLGFRFGRRG